MTSPLRQESPPSVFSPLTDGVAEVAHEPSAEAREALQRDQAELQREVILWQRWVRYLAVIVLSLAAVLLSGRRDELARLPLLVVSMSYVVCVFAAGWAVRKAPSLTKGQWLPALLVTADLITIGTIIYITTPPLLSYRFLILALLSVQFAAFYFGWALGLYATLLSVVIYVLLAHGLSPLVPGPRPTGILNVALFGLVAAVLTATFGSFRARMNHLRLFCKVIEEGELNIGLDLTAAKYPDDLTLLARSFDAMRNGLAEQVGTDPLTGCMNRRALEARLKADWRQAKEVSVLPVAVKWTRSPLRCGKCRSKRASPPGRHTIIRSCSREENLCSAIRDTFGRKASTITPPHKISFAT